MAHFIGEVKGSRGEGTRCGTKNSGLSTIAASWSGCITVRLYHDETTDKDRYIIRQSTWQGAGIDREIATGEIGK
jgi:hypothetical protein